MQFPIFVSYFFVKSIYGFSIFYCKVDLTDILQLEDEDYFLKRIFKFRNSYF